VAKLEVTMSVCLLPALLALVVVSDKKHAFYLRRFHNHPPKKGALSANRVACDSGRLWQGTWGATSWRKSRMSCLR